MTTTVDETPTGRRPTRRSAPARLHRASTRDRLVEAAVHEFAVNGFAGASTRAIAEAAGSHQPQINYFFGSKVELWQTVVAELFADLGRSMSDIDTGDEPGAVLASVIERFVRYTHRRPELNQILYHEFASPGDRLDWLVDAFTGPAFADFHRWWDAAAAAGETAVVDRRVVFHLFVGAASLLPVAIAEATRQFGTDPAELADAPSDLVTAHALSLVGLFLPGRVRPDRLFVDAPPERALDLDRATR